MIILDLNVTKLGQILVFHIYQLDFKNILMLLVRESCLVKVRKEKEIGQQTEG